MTKCPQCGGLNDPANITVIFLSRFRLRDFDDAEGNLHGKVSMVGLATRYTSMNVATINATTIDAIVQWNGLTIAIMVFIRPASRLSSDSDDARLMFAREVVVRTYIHK